MPLLQSNYFAKGYDASANFFAASPMGSASAGVAPNTAADPAAAAQGWRRSGPPGMKHGLFATKQAAPARPSTGRGLRRAMATRERPGGRARSGYTSAKGETP